MALVSGYMDLVNYGYLELSRCHMGHPMLPLDFFSNPSFVFTIPSLIGVHKVDMFNSATNLNWTIVFEWYVVKVRLWERIPKKDVSKRDWSMYSNYHNLSRLSSQHDWSNIWPFNEHKNFCFDDHKIFIWAPKLIRTVPSASPIWICSLSRTNIITCPMF